MKFLIANWKMNKNFDDGLKVIKAIRNKIKNKTNKKFIILPPLQSTHYIKNNLIKNDIIFGSQDCSQFKNGAFTGDISAEMIKKIGCKYILVGHSERRTIFNETDEILKRKIANNKLFAKNRAATTAVNLVKKFAELLPVNMPEKLPPPIPPSAPPSLL